MTPFATSRSPSRRFCGPACSDGIVESSGMARTAYAMRRACAAILGHERCRARGETSCNRDTEPGGRPETRRSHRFGPVTTCDGGVLIQAVTPGDAVMARGGQRSSGSSAEAIGQQRHAERVVVRAVVAKQRIVVVVDEELPRPGPDEPRVPRRGRQIAAVGALRSEPAPVRE